MKYIPGRQGTKTKKSLGQHWLKDVNILESIADSAEIKQGDSVLEIGPGLGTLTEILVNRGANVVAVEFDQDLIKNLQEKFNTPQVKILEGDVRTFDFNQMPADYKIVANIPYYLTSHLIRSISEAENQPKIVALLIQKEVAQRICAEPGQMGVLSVVAQYHYKCSLGVEVSADYFEPPPKVDSQVVIMEKYPESLYENVVAENYIKLVKAGFSEKRKTLRNSLSGGLGINKDMAEDMLKKANIDINTRAQQLSLDDWHQLYLVYTK